MEGSDTGTYTRDDCLPRGHVVAGRYEIDHPLGTGGMGSVYLAEDQVLGGELVAIKILHSEFAFDERHTQRFLREVQLMRRVNHENVVRTFDVGADGSLVYFTMEYIAGRSLDDMIYDQPFPRSQIPRLIIQVCEGLEAVHGKNIIHRDLKPGNLMVLSSGTVKITDFGVARPEVSELTAHNEIVGSASYMAPEIWLGRAITGSVDLYSLGIILYELTTGELPFDAESPGALMRLHLERPPTPPLERNSSIAPWLNRLILSLLEKSPKDRPGSAREVINIVKKHFTSKSKEDELLGEDFTDTSKSFIAKLELLTKLATDEKEDAPLPHVDGSKKTESILATSFFQSIVRQVLPTEHFLRSAMPLTTKLLGKFVVTLLGCSIPLLILGMGLRTFVHPAPEVLNQVAYLTSGVPRAESLHYLDVLISYCIPNGALLLLLLLVPATLIGSMANGTREIFRALYSAGAFFTVATTILFALAIFPAFSTGGINAHSLLAALLATGTQLTELALLAPFTTVFETTVQGNTLFLFPLEMVGFTHRAPVTLLAISYVLFLTYLARRALQARVYYRGGPLFILPLGLLMLLLVESSLFNGTRDAHGVFSLPLHQDPTLTLQTWLPSLINWLFVYTTIGGLIVYRYCRKGDT